MIVNIQVGTLVLAAATLVGAAVGAGVQIGWHYWKRERRKETLRCALRSEILSMRPFLSGNRGPQDQFLRDSVYRSNAGDIGMLTRKEVESIVGFYGSVTSIQRAINESNTGHMEPPNLPTLTMETDVHDWFNRAVYTLDENIEWEDIDAEEEMINFEPFTT